MITLLNIIKYAAIIVGGILILIKVIGIIKNVKKGNEAKHNWEQAQQQELQQILDKQKELNLPENTDSDGHLQNLSSQCKGCGVSLPLIQDGKVIAHCPYCGASVENSRELVEKAFELSKIQQEHNNKMEEMNRRMEHIKDMDRSDNRSILIMVFGTIGGFIALILVLKFVVFRF